MQPNINKKTMEESKQQDSNPTMNSSDIQSYVFGRHYHNMVKNYLDQPHWCDFSSSRGVRSLLQAFWTYQKKKHGRNTIILVRNGQFYEAFHTDADILHVHLAAPYCHGKCAWNGFPLNQFEAYKSALEQYGFNVIVIDKDTASKWTSTDDGAMAVRNYTKQYGTSIRWCN